MSAYFEFNFEELDNNELRINGRRADFLSFRQWRSIIIKKEWIFWIITTLRNLTWLDYNSGGKEIIKEYDDCELAIIMFLLEGEYSFIKIFPVWKVEVDIKINYADNLRPTDFDVTYIIKTSDGKIEKTENLFFLN